MKFTIEVDDFWLDEDDDIASGLRSHICHDVVCKISKSIEDKVQTQITAKVNEVIDEKMTLVIDSTLSDLVATSLIKSGSKEITIEQHLKDAFQHNHGWSNPTSKMEAIAKKFGDELKLQYNNAFANKIVQNMKAQGLLKDEVVQILLAGDQVQPPTT